MFHPPNIVHVSIPPHLRNISLATMSAATVYLMAILEIDIGKIFEYPRYSPS